MQMCPIYIEAVIQISKGPQNVKEGRLQALQRSQEWKLAYPAPRNCGVTIPWALSGKNRRACPGQQKWLLTQQAVELICKTG